MGGAFGGSQPRSNSRTRPRPPGETWAPPPPGLGPACSEPSLPAPAPSDSAMALLLEGLRAPRPRGHHSCQTSAPSRLTGKTEPPQPPPQPPLQGLTAPGPPPLSPCVGQAGLLCGLGRPVGQGRTRGRGGVLHDKLQ